MGRRDAVRAGRGAARNWTPRQASGICAFGVPRGTRETNIAMGVQTGPNLDSFNLEERLTALRALAAAGRDDLPAAGENLNLHFHSFFSYNSEGWSPSHLAWAARRRGLYAAGLCDFDVLDGLEEFLEAGRILGLRVTVNLETRAFVREFADREISSPGEAGVTYIMGAGFARVPSSGPQARTLGELRAGAQARNAALVARINARLRAFAVDYRRDVLPLTPAGGATERHIIRGYLNRARALHSGDAALAASWAEILGRPSEAVLKLLADPPALEEAVRSKLVKKGGLGYEPPSPSGFPPVEEFTAWVRSCEAVPMIAWLDGTSGGEADAKRLLEVMQAAGCAALNIIPDRNWNLKDAHEAAKKRAKLAEIVAACDARGLPLNIGTEMNKRGLPLVDDLSGEALRPHRASFLRGARVLVGHSLLLRYAGFSYAGAGAAAEFPELRRKNAFFERVGGLPPLTETLGRKLEDLGPAKALAAMREAAQAGKWVG